MSTVLAMLLSVLLSLLLARPVDVVIGPRVPGPAGCSVDPSGCGPDRGR